MAARLARLATFVALLFVSLSVCRECSAAVNGDSVRLPDRRPSAGAMSRSLLNKGETGLPFCDEDAEKKMQPGRDCRERGPEMSDDHGDHEHDKSEEDHDEEGHHDDHGDEESEEDHDEEGHHDDHGDDDHEQDHGSDEDEDGHDHDHEDEDGHDHGGEEHRHSDHGGEGEAVSFLEFLGDEEPVGHALELLGVVEGAALRERELAMLLEAVSEGVEEEEGEDPHGHNHGHDHGHGHKKEEEPEVAFRLTADSLMDTYGTVDGLAEDGLGDACLAILACQVDGRCALGEEGRVIEEEEEEDELMVLKAIASGVLFVEVLIGGVIPYLLRYIPGHELYISLLNTFSGGVILATGLIHLVPEVIEEQFSINLANEYPLGMVMMTTGFLLVFFLEQILFDAHGNTGRRRKECHHQPIILSIEMKAMPSGKVQTEKTSGLDTRNSLGTPTSVDPEPAGLSGLFLTYQNGLILLVAMTAHGLLEGFLVGFQDQKSKLLILLASIASHKVAAAMALSSRFMKSGCPFSQTFVFVFIFSLMGPLSIFLGTVLDDVPSMIHLVLNGLASGTFLYIGAYEVVHEEFSDDHDHQSPLVADAVLRVWKFVSMVLGIVAISLIALIPHEHGD